MQIRDLDGLVDTRYKLLMNKETLIFNWVGYAVALHLKGNFESCLKVLSSIHKLIKEQKAKKYEVSEVR